MRNLTKTLFGTFAIFCFPLVLCVNQAFADNAQRNQSSFSNRRVVKDISGVWTGKYRCAQGWTGATFTIHPFKFSKQKANMLFYALPNNPHVPSGEITYEVTFNSKTGKTVFKPLGWVKRPSGFNMISISGAFDRSEQHFAGKISDSGCSIMILTRRTTQPEIKQVDNNTAKPPPRKPARAVYAAKRPSSRSQSGATSQNIEGRWEGLALCGTASMRVVLEINKKAGIPVYSAKFQYPFFKSDAFTIRARGENFHIAHGSLKSAKKIKEYLGDTTFQVSKSATFAQRLFFIRHQNKNRYVNCEGMIFFEGEVGKWIGSDKKDSFCSGLYFWNKKANKHSENIIRILSRLKIKYDELTNLRYRFKDGISFKKVFLNAFADMSKAQRKDFYSKSLACYMYSEWSGKASIPIKVFFKKSFIRDWKKKRKSNILNLLDIPQRPVSDYLSEQKLELSPVAVTNSFKSDVAKLLSKMNEGSLRAKIDPFLHRWSGKYEAIAPDLLIDTLNLFEEAKRTGKTPKLTALSHALYSKHNLQHGPSSYANLAKGAPLSDYKFKFKNKELLLGSHIGVRHYVKADFNCKTPMIRTVALAEIPQSSNNFAYDQAVASIRQHCGIEHRPVSISIAVRAFLGDELNAIFRLVDNPRNEPKATLQTMNLVITPGTRASNPIAQTYWNNPSSPDKIPTTALDFVTGDLKADLHLLSSFKGDMAAMRTDAKLSSVVDAGHFKKALELKQPNAISIDYLAENDTDQYRSTTALAFVMKFGLDDYLGFLEHDIINKNFISLTHIDSLKKLGIELVNIPGKRALSYQAIDQKPSNEQSLQAINALLKINKCREFPFLFRDPKANPGRLKMLASLFYKRKDDACVIGFTGAEIAMKINSVKLHSCHRNGQSYHCTIAVKYDCGGLGMLRNDYRTKVACNLLFKQFSFIESKWIFNRVSEIGDRMIVMWSARPQQ